MTKAIIYRCFSFALLWWVLAEGRLDAWWLGAVAVAAATWASLRLAPPGQRQVSLPGLAGFLAFFLRNSLRGGVQVAFLALRPDPGLRPATLEVSVSLPAGAPRVLMLNTLGLMPGTLGVRLDGERLKLHVLDVRLPVAEEARALEAHIARMFGLSK